MKNTIQTLLQKVKSWLQTLEFRLRIWMSGRYGYDGLAAFLWIAGILLCLLSLIKPLQFLSYLAVLVWAFAIFRVLSKNYAQRRKEQAVYQRVTGRIRSEFSFWKLRWNGRKEWRYFRCRSCRTILRVPKGKGKIIITCPKCHSEINAKS